MTFIDPRAKVFRHLDRVSGWADGRKPAPVTIEWDLSNRCVLGCQDCHFAHTHTRGPWMTKLRRLPMAFDQPGDLADPSLVKRVLGEAAGAGVRSVIWTGGGEPTTHPDWEDVLVWADDVGLQQGMYTLGGLFTPMSAGHAARRLTWVVVSLDCADRETYAVEKGVRPERFEAALNGIRWLTDSGGATVGVSFLLHANNWRRMDDMLALSRSLGSSYTSFRPAVQTSPDAPSRVTGDLSWLDAAMPSLRAMRAERDVEIDPDRFAEYGNWKGHGYTACHGIRLNTTITPDGRMWVCPQRRGLTEVGDLRSESFSEVWARHSGSFRVDDGCRVSCRLHPLNQTLDRIEQPLTHENFM